MLVLTSLKNAQAAYAAHRPGHVLSLLSEEEEAPVFADLPAERHIRLYMDEESCAAAISRAAQERARELIRFIEGWDGSGNILVHCNRGVSRSAAAAYIILCALDPDADEAAILADIRRLAPHIDPCPLFVHYADTELDRDGRMLDAIEDLCPPSTVLAAPVAVLQTARDAVAAASA